MVPTSRHASSRSARDLDLRETVEEIGGPRVRRALTACRVTVHFHSLSTSGRCEGSLIHCPETAIVALVGSSH